MIIKIDHVALATVDFNKHIKIIGSLGYVPQFMERGIKNLEIKRSLMEKYCKQHDLALFKREGSFPIELIDHGHAGSKSSRIIPIFENISGALFEKLGGHNLADMLFMKAKLKSLDAYIYISENRQKEGPRFNKLVIETGDVIASATFWSQLGFKVLITTEDLALLELKSFFGKEIYQIFLQRCDNACIQHLLDDNGFNCVALVSNSATYERSALGRLGISTTEIEKIKLSHRTLDIFFAKGPCGELVEVIGV